MRNLKRFYAAAVSTAMLVSIMAPAASFAAIDSTTDAKSLYDLGLYKGLSETEYQPDLDSTLNRQTAATMLLRMIGLEDDALAMDEKEAQDILAKKFKDADTVAAWAAKQLAYAVDAGIFAGFPDGTVQPNGLVTGKQFCTLVLKSLGYNDFTFDGSVDKFASVAGLDATEKAAFGSNSAIKKGILCSIARKALNAKYEGSNVTLGQQLIKDGVIDAAKAQSLLGIVAPTATTAPSATPSSVVNEAYKGVELTIASNPTMMAKEVNDFTVLSFDLKNNNSQDVALSQFTITMDKFLGDPEKVRDVKIWDGATKKSPGTGKWTTSNYTSVINLTTPVTVKAGETKTFKVTADVGTNVRAVLGEQYKFIITDMQFANMTDMPTKGLPLTANSVSVSTVDEQATISVVDETKTSNYNPANAATAEKMPIGGRNIEVGKFRLTAPDDEKAVISAIKITNLGSAGAGRIESVQLYKGETLLGTNEVDQMINFDTALEIPAAESVVLTVKVNTSTDLKLTDTFQAQIEEATDLIATGDKFGSAMKFKEENAGYIWKSRSLYQASNAEVKVSSVASAQSSDIIKGASDFSLGKVYVSNNNVEDVKLSTLGLRLKVRNAGAEDTITAGTIKNIRLLSPSGTVLATKTSLTNSDYNDPAGAADSYYSIDFSLSTEYLIAKNADVGFNVVCDMPTLAAGDVGKTVALYYVAAGEDSMSVNAQSSGDTLYEAAAPNTTIDGKTINLKSAGDQKLAIVEDSKWDNPDGVAIAAGDERVIVDWKIKDDSLSEDANVKKITLQNKGADNPSTYMLTDFVLYYDGVKIASVASMNNNNEIVFGNGDTTLFTVKDGDSVGKKLVVKAKIDDSAANADKTLDFVLANVNNLEAKGVSTGEDIKVTDESVSANGVAGLALTNDKLIKTRYATFEKLANTTGSVPQGGNVEILKFKVTPQSGESIDLHDMVITLDDKQGTIRTADNNGLDADVIKVYDVTDGVQDEVTGAWAPGTKTFTFADDDFGDVSEAKVFSVKVDATRGTASFGNTGRAFQVGISYVANHLQIEAPTQDGVRGFVALGDNIVGDMITVTVD